MQHKALEKKSNIEYLEQIGWQQFLPKFVIEGIPVGFIHCCWPRRPVDIDCAGQIANFRYH